MYQLMRAAVDYAGLFPPAGLPLNEVVANYSNYLQSGERSMLGRLIVPALKLSEFETAAQDYLPTGNGTAPWRISALIPPIEQRTELLETSKFDSAVDAIRSFNDRHRNQNRVIVDALEVAAPTVKVIKATIQGLPENVSSFVEISDLSNPEPMIDFVSQALISKTISAKIRTGGITADLIPPPSDVARFISACARHDVGFKATAGLHHPIRAQYRLTYEEDSPQAKLFGFLNVFFATMIAFEHGVSEDVLTEILSNEDASRFVFDDHKLSWDSLDVSAERVAVYRKRAIISFGSCSFVEPTTELQQLPDVSYASVFSE
jgi:hypothetical protein